MRSDCVREDGQVRSVHDQFPLRLFVFNQSPLDFGRVVFPICAFGVANKHHLSYLLCSPLCLFLCAVLVFFWASLVRAVTFVLCFICPNYYCKNAFYNLGAYDYEILSGKLINLVSI